MQDPRPIARLAVLGLAVLLAGARSESEKLIVGFETEELSRTKWTMFEEKTGEGWFYLLDRPEGFDFAARFEVPGTTNRAWTWRCRPGEHTEGDLALVGRVGPANPQNLTPSFRKTEFLSRYYPSIYRSLEARFVMSTFQWLTKGRPELRDWRGYDLLRADVRCAASPVTLRLAVEDDVIEPPVVTSYEIPPGRWMTVELDLRKAVAARELDLGKIANFWVLGVSAKSTELRLDNVRLAKRGTLAALEVLRDDSPLTVEVPKPERPRLPDRGDLPAPDRSPLKLGKPIVVAEGTMAPFGWTAAWDNNHLFVACGEGKGGKALHTRDGGKTWEELGRPVISVLDHQTARGGALDPWGDGAALSSGPGCGGHAGIGKATPRQHFTKYTFTKDGWKERMPDILDADIRHCASNAAVTRVPRGPTRGRLWASWGAIGRNHAMSVHVKYSDDDGYTWIPWGRGAELPGSKRGDWSNGTYGYPITEIVPHGDHVAVFWRHKGERGLFWSRYDGKTWSAPAVVVDAALRMDGAYAESMTAVAAGGKEIFFTTTGLGTVLRWDGEGWGREPVGADDGLLSLAGETLLIFTSGKVQRRWSGRGWTRKAAIRVHRRGPDGTWADPVTLVPELRIHEYRSLTGFAVPRYAPPNFVPLVWSDADEGVVKLLRVPVPAR